MNLKDLFFTDKRAETDGRKLYLAKAKKAGTDEVDDDKSVWLLIARKGNTNYKTYLQQLLQENSAVLGTKSAEAESLAQRLFKDAAANHLLIGWSVTGIDYGTERNLPFTTANAAKLMEMDDFYNLVDNFAGDMANYRASEVIKEAKNSVTT